MQITHNDITRYETGCEKYHRKDYFSRGGGVPEFELRLLFLMTKWNFV